jgi:CBS domain-containing protein
MATTVQTHPLISIRDSETVSEAARVMADCSIGAIGVLGDDRRFAGILTERDISWLVAQGKVASEVLIKDVVNDFPVVVEAPIDDSAALDQMRRARVRHLIVREGDDFRIVSMRDYLLTKSGSDVSSGALARDVMTAPAIACRDEAFFEEVAEILAERDISGMPVVDRDGQVVGVISERDLAYALGGPMVRLALRRHNEHPLHGVADLPRGARRAREIMTTPALTVTTETHLEDVARIMSLHEVNRVPVVEDGRLIGVVTRGDVLGALAHLKHQPIDLTSPPVLVGSSGTHPGNGMYL